MSPEEVTNDYVQQIAKYHSELRSRDWHDHELIKATGIMEYTLTVEEMKMAFAQKKEAARRMQEKLWKEVSERWTAPQLLRTLDSYSLSEGLVLQRVPEVSSGEPEQVGGKTRGQTPASWFTE